MNTKETDYKIDSLGAKCSLLDRTFNDVPRIVTEIITEYEYLFSVSFLQNDQIWVYGKDNKIRLYNIQGELMKSFQIESWPKGIAVTSNGGIVYTDDTLNITNKRYQLEGALSLVDWIHCNVCNTFSGDLLVVMVSNDIFQQSKVVRYDYGLSETQCIQYDDEGDYLYSSGGCPKHISENRNLDICVSDYGAHAEVVVNQAGELRFTYTGPPSITKVPFYPFGITTDSQSRILTSDYGNHRIHIIDQYGQFLHYIDNCDLKNPGGLCVDNRDNLFVVECTRSKVKKIQYYT
ncbi:tripartite motif-containing protein 2-like [Crassostrea angulata]|uniref:tripartite motif-containing protein 2-like n=1 Tax=Magallana angulata TaxID=2784310 RepID=UPI0022B0D658|nr:tripartite motif-containing protein 2-like [Crassostrea angulata]